LSVSLCAAKRSAATLIRVSGAALLERGMIDKRPGYEDYVRTWSWAGRAGVRSMVATPSAPCAPRCKARSSPGN
jgi:hypothetical protein